MEKVPAGVTEIDRKLSEEIKRDLLTMQRNN
jgi:hypothetical protein